MQFTGSKCKFAEERHNLDLDYLEAFWVMMFDMTMQLMNCIFLYHLVYFAVQNSDVATALQVMTHEVSGVNEFVESLKNMQSGLDAKGISPPENFNEMNFSSSQNGSMA